MQQFVDLGQLADEIAPRLIASTASFSVPKPVTTIAMMYG
jgi:hypothetical protein